MVGWRDSNGDLIARQLSSKPRPYDAGGDGGKGLSHLCLERLAYVPVLPEVLRGACLCGGPVGLLMRGGATQGMLKGLAWGWAV